MKGSQTPHIPLVFERVSEEEMLKRSKSLLERMRGRRSVRHFDSAPVPLEVLKRCIEAAGTAPSGAHKQPWTFCLVTNPEVKRSIREAAEKEEYENYHGRMSDRWLEDLKPFDTDHLKPHLEEAPALIAIFRQSWTPVENGSGGKKQHYYVQESVGIASGMLINALHESGLATLTHTPSPMGFLSEILGRPSNEHAYLLIPVGYPASNCCVPEIKRKDLEEIMVEIH